MQTVVPTLPHWASLGVALILFSLAKPAEVGMRLAKREAARDYALSGSGADAFSVRKATLDIRKQPH
ncbi:MAG: hypothetical protein H8E20_03685 [Verrucomicrobia bacterium]|nr:hypothetical protein [Verrucomicrobiota bacterium]